MSLLGTWQVLDHAIPGRGCRADRDLPSFHPRFHGHPPMCLRPLSQFQEEIPALPTGMFNVFAPVRITVWTFASHKVGGLMWRSDSRAAQVLMVHFLTVAMLSHSIDGPVSCLSPMKTRRPCVRDGLSPAADLCCDTNTRRNTFPGNNEHPASRSARHLDNTSAFIS